MAINVVYAESELQLASATVVYTVPANKKYAIIEAVTVVNNAGTDQNHTVWLVANGSSAVNANRYITNKTVSTGATIVDSDIVGQSLNAGDTIQCQADADSAISIRFTIKEVV